MREILFRGYVAGTSEGWVYGLLCETGKIFSEIIGRGFCKHNVTTESVGQWTGLYDKNNVRIFEGDIVQYGDTIHRVVFEQRNGTAYFGLVYGPDETLPFGHYQDLRQITVIGNIFDNPELLGGDP